MFPCSWNRLQHGNTLFGKTLYFGRIWSLQDYLNKQCQFCIMHKMHSSSCYLYKFISIYVNKSAHKKLKLLILICKVWNQPTLDYAVDYCMMGKPFLIFIDAIYWPLWCKYRNILYVLKLILIDSKEEFLMDTLSKYSNLAHILNTVKHKLKYSLNIAGFCMWLRWHRDQFNLFPPYT